MSTNTTNGVCPKCGAELFSPDAMFCIQCGTRVSNDAPTQNVSFGDVYRSDAPVSAMHDPNMTMTADAYCPPSYGQQPVPTASGSASVRSESSSEAKSVFGDEPEQIPNQNPYGYNQNLIGYNQILFGYNQNLNGYNQDLNGYNQNLNDYSQNPQQPYPSTPSSPAAGKQKKKTKAPFGNMTKTKWLVPLIISSVAGVILLFGVGFLAWKHVLVPSNEYDRACSLMDDGKYDEAIDIFEDLGDYKDSSDRITESNYQIALRTLENEEYNTAEALFEKLGDYRDSEEMVLESKYRYGISLINDEFYTEAVSVFEELDGYSESYAYLHEAKYLYCLESSDCTDRVTYEYLTELKDISYKDSENLYHKLYDLRLEVVFCNDDSSDQSYINYSVSKYATFFHIGFQISGGTPDETFNLYRVITYPDGNSKKYTNDPWLNKCNDEIISTKWSEGFYSDPEYGITGNMFVDIYNLKTNKRIKRVTVKITD